MRHRPRLSRPDGAVRPPRLRADVPGPARGPHPQRSRHRHDGGRRDPHRRRDRHDPRGRAGRPVCPRPSPLHPDVVELAGFQVQAVHDLPQRGQRFQRVALLERRQLSPVLRERALQRVVRIDELLLTRVHRSLRSPSDPITTLSSTNRFAFSSNRGSEPSSACFTPNRSPSCASARAFPRSRTIRSASALPSGISTRISISSRMPPSVYRWIWNSSISGNSRTMASTARGYTFVPRTRRISSTLPRIPPSYRSKVRPHEHADAGCRTTRSRVRYRSTGMNPRPNDVTTRSPISPYPTGSSVAGSTTSSM